MRLFGRGYPSGVNLDVVANQPNVVQVSIGEFTRSLVEAVVIVLAVSFFSLGWRPGIVVALCIPIVFALTFATMLALGHTAPSRVAGRAHHRARLLVDDAIIVVEQIDTHLHSGWEKLKAVTSAYLVTAQPMLIGTLVTMLGFLPIALARSAAGEYASSIFAVVAISLAFVDRGRLRHAVHRRRMLPEPAKGAAGEPASRWLPTVLMTGRSIPALPRSRAVGADRRKLVISRPPSCSPSPSACSLWACRSSSSRPPTARTDRRSARIAKCLLCADSGRHPAPGKLIGTIPM
jgi:hypothetical protein